MKRVLTATVFVLAAAASFAGPVPKAIKARYNELEKVMEKLDFKAFQTFFAPDFVNVSAKGETASREEFMASVKPLFESATKGSAKVKFLDAATKGDIVTVKFVLHLNLTGKNGTTKVHEEGTDSWKKVGGKWVFVKTVDTLFTVKTPKGK